MRVARAVVLIGCSLAGLVGVTGVMTIAACTAGTSSPSPSSEGGALVGSPPEDAAAEASEPRCTPGSFVFCRCADRSEGTKECIGGTMFAPCSPCTDDAGL